MPWSSSQDFCKDEKAAFPDACRRQGFRVDQFQFTLAQSIDDEGFMIWLEDVLDVIRSDGCRRIYRVPSFGGACNSGPFFNVALVDQYFVSFVSFFC
jgi:hypothetical protein